MFSRSAQMRYVLIGFLLAVTFSSMPAVFSRPTGESKEDEEGKAAESKALFGYWNDSNEFVEATEIPFKKNRSYGWRIFVGKKSTPVRWKERLHLPAKPAVWSGEAQKLLHGGRTAVVKKTEMPVDGWLQHHWGIHAGDPRGKYKMQVKIEGQPEHKFEFTLN